MRCPKSFLRGLSLLKDDRNETRRSCGEANELQRERAVEAVGVA